MRDRVVVTRGTLSDTLACHILVNDRTAYFSGFVRPESGDEFLYRGEVWQIIGVRAHQLHTEVEFRWLRAEDTVCRT